MNLICSRYGSETSEPTLITVGSKSRLCEDNSPTSPTIMISTSDVDGAMATTNSGTSNISSNQTQQKISKLRLPLRNDCPRGCGNIRNRISNSEDRSSIVTSGNLTSPQIDSRLNEWLLRHNIDSTSRNIIFYEEFTYEDFMYNTDKTDLQRLGLK